MTDELTEAFDNCLNALAAGASLDDCLAHYPALRDELRSLIKVAGTAQAMGASATVPQPAEMSSRAKFLAGGAQLRPASLPRRAGWWPVPRAAVALAVLVFVVAGTGGVVAASAQSLPGDVLYGVKRTVEQTQLLFTLDEDSRSQLQGEFDERRVVEAQTVTMQKRTTRVEFSGRVESMEGERWSVRHITVLLSPETRVEGEPSLGASVEVSGTSQEDGTVLASLIAVTDAGAPVIPMRPTPTASATTRVVPTSTPPPTATRLPTEPASPAPANPLPGASPTSTAEEGEEEEFTGLVESISANVWRIGGQDVTITPATEISGSPQVGQMVKVKAVRDRSGALVARHIEVKEATGQPEKSPTPQPPKTPEPSATHEADETHEADKTHEPSETPTPTRTPTP
jgi:hypothetical protein